MLKLPIKDFHGFFDSILFASKNEKNIKLWWRGQANSSWPLIPKIYRKGHNFSEESMNHRFMNKARSRYAKCPAKHDFPSWLFLMQHYGLPTRLLDWSESPLIALHFAVHNKKYDEEEGALWGLNPIKFNEKESGENRIYLPDNKFTAPIFAAAFSIEKADSSKKNCAVQTDEFDIRHMVQLSVFTIHGVSEPLDSLYGEAGFLFKIVIPSETKQKFRRSLRLIGVSESSIFPDLEHLAKEIEATKFSIQL